MPLTTQLLRMEGTSGGFELSSLLKAGPDMGSDLTLSSWVMKISKDGGCTTSLSILSHFLTVSMGKSFIVISSLNRLNQFVSTASCPSTAQYRRVWLHLLDKQLRDIDRLLSGHLEAISFRLNMPWSLSLPSQGQCSSPWTSCLPSAELVPVCQCLFFFFLCLSMCSYYY